MMETPFEFSLMVTPECLRGEVRCKRDLLTPEALGQMVALHNFIGFCLFSEISANTAKMNDMRSWVTHDDDYSMAVAEVLFDGRHETGVAIVNSVGRFLKLQLMADDPSLRMFPQPVGDA